MSQRIWLVALAFFALLAAGLRLWGSVSAPIMPHPDEFVFPVVRPLKLLSGDLNPHNFTYPTFHLYLLGLVYGLFFVVQKLLGAGWSRVEFAAYYIFWDSDALVFWARATSVAFAAATVVWVGALARRLYGPGLGLAAAALLALNVIHVRQAALASVDAALACWCLGAVWAAVRLCEREELRDYALAGLLVGLATGTKYPAAVLGGAVAVAHLLAGRGLGDRRLWFSGLVGALTFVATSPYIILDYETFLQHFRFQVSHASQGRGAADAAWYQVFFNLRHGSGTLGLLLLLVGLGRAFYRRERDALVVVAAFLLFYGAISWGKLVFVRYSLPLLPLMAVLVVGGLGLVRHRWGQGILLALLMAYPLYGSVRVAHLMGRVEARRWIEEHVPTGTVCCNFGGWAGDVPLRTFEDQQWRLMQFEGSFGDRAVTEVMDFLDESKPARPFYFHVLRTAKQEVERGSWEQVAKYSCAYVILHRHPLAYSQVDEAFATALAERGERVRVWRPEGLAEAAPLYDADDAYYLPLANFGPLRQPGPEIELWRLAQHPEGEASAWEVQDIFARTYAVWAHYHYLQGDLDKAVSYYLEALHLSPDLPHYLEALHLSPDYPQALNRLVDILADESASPQALNKFVDILSRELAYITSLEEHCYKQYADSTVAGEKLADLWSQLGFSAVESRRYDMAIHIYQRGLLTGLDNAFFLNSLGVAYSRKGDLKSTASFLEKAYQLSPEDELIVLNLAQFYATQRDASRAVQILSNALATSPENRQFLDMLENLGKLPD